MLNFFAPRPGRFGTQTVSIDLGALGGSNYIGGATVLTASGTTTFYLPAPTLKMRFIKFSAFVNTVPVTSGGTLLARVRKVNGATVNTVSADIDLAALSTKVASVVGPLSTATDPNRLFNGTTDGVQIDVVSNAAIGTQPVNLQFRATFEVLQ